MKTFLFSLVFIGVLAVAGYFGYTYLQMQSSQTTSPPTTEEFSSTETGLLMPGMGDDYSYVLLAEGGKTIGIASQQIQLEQFVNKRVTITGSYSGTTLYAYTVDEVQ